MLKIRPQFSIGFSRSKYKLSNSYCNILEGNEVSYETSYHIYKSPTLKPSISFLLGYENPVSLIIDVGYMYYLKNIKYNYYEINKDLNLSNISLELGILLHI